jgi:hypothetical protein
MPEKERIAAIPQQKTETKGAISSMFAWPQAFRALADRQAVQGKEAMEALSTAAQDTYSTNIKALTEYGQKVIKAGQQDADRAYECWRELIGVRSLPEFIEVWASHAPRQFDTMSNRTGEFLGLFCRMTADATKPITNSGMNMRAGSR